MKEKKFLILDVEATGDLSAPLTYDIGGVVVNKRGEVYEKFSFVVADIFVGEQELMKSAYYYEKIGTHYKPGLKDGSFTMKRFNTVKFFIRDLLKQYNITDVYAYNASYDRRALNNTAKFIDEKYRWFLPYGINIGCIWHMACQVICTQKSYHKFCEENNLITAKGNLKTSAETVYAYMIDDASFVEQHTGFCDAEIEAEIFARCIRQHKKMDKKINSACWRIPQDRG